MVKLPDGTRVYPKEYPNLVMRKRTPEAIAETRRMLEELQMKTVQPSQKPSNKNSDVQVLNINSLKKVYCQ